MGFNSSWMLKALKESWRIPEESQQMWSSWLKGMNPEKGAGIGRRIDPAEWKPEIAEEIRCQRLKKKGEESRGFPRSSFVSRHGGKRRNSNISTKRFRIPHSIRTPELRNSGRIRTYPVSAASFSFPSHQSNHFKLN